jgi:hypothetical protein
MLYEEENAVNQAAYKRLRATIDAKYPKGHFVGIAGGEIVADAGSFEGVSAKLDELGWEPLKTMVVLAGDETPDYIEILTPYWTGPDA